MIRLQWSNDQIQDLIKCKQFQRVYILSERNYDIINTHAHVTSCMLLFPTILLQFPIKINKSLKLYVYLFIYTCYTIIFFSIIMILHQTVIFWYCHTNQILINKKFKKSFTRLIFLGKKSVYKKQNNLFTYIFSLY